MVGRCRGAEEGRGRVPLGLCAGPVGRWCSRLETRLPGQPPPRRQAAGAWATGAPHRDGLGLNTTRSGEVPALEPVEQAASAVPGDPQWRYIGGIGALMLGGGLVQGCGGGGGQQGRALRGAGGRAPSWGTRLPWPPFLEDRGRALLGVAAQGSAPPLLGCSPCRGPLRSLRGQSPRPPLP
jgi:hypothetical protein